jgi:hypothetical protein
MGFLSWLRRGGELAGARSISALDFGDDTASIRKAERNTPLQIARDAMHDAGPDLARLLKLNGGRAQEFVAVLMWKRTRSIEHGEEFGIRQADHASAAVYAASTRSSA